MVKILTPFKTDVDVPILGQQFELVRWYPTVIITCKATPHCVEKNAVVVVIGQGTSKCPICDRPYQLEQLDYDRAKSEVKINLGVGPGERGEIR